MSNLYIIKGYDIETKEFELLMYQYIPFGIDTIVQGDSSEGKGTFIVNIATIITKGISLPFINKIIYMLMKRIY